MSAMKHSGVAFPTKAGNNETSSWASSPGMTLMDHVAVQAMQGILAGDMMNAGTLDLPPYEVAQMAYDYAEAMMLERMKR